MTFKEYIEHDMGAFGKVRIQLVYDYAKGTWVRKPLDLISEDDGKDLGISEEERDIVNAVHRKLQEGGPPLESWEFIEFNVGIDK